MQYNACFDRYQYGIIYAIRFAEEDVIHMGNSRAMGITHLSPLKPDKIIAKLLVDQGEKAFGFTNDKQRFTNNMAWKNRIPPLIKGGLLLELPPFRRVLPPVTGFDQSSGSL